MDPSARKWQFSNAFIFAIAAAAGCSVSQPTVDNDSIDWTISNRLSRRPKLDVQLKCTASDDGAGAFITHSLSPKNYADLILTDLIAPRILIVVTVPSLIDEWVQVVPDQMVLRRCGFWVSLRGLPESANTESVTVRIPRVNLFTVESLSEMMAKVNGDEAL
jgi:hypothetical protein